MNIKSPRNEYAQFRIRGALCAVCDFEIQKFGDGSFGQCTKCGAHSICLEYDKFVTSTKVVEDFDPTKHEA